MSEPFYITTAISYPNGKPHIGHAYEAIAADAMARFQRAQGRDVRLVTGTDEHGLKMVQTARAAGRDTLEFADEMSGYFRDMCHGLNISYDAFVRTTEPRHYEASHAIWKAMEASDDLYIDRYEGWYSVRDEAFYDESELIDGEGGERLSPQGTRSNGPSRKPGSSACPNIRSRCSSLIGTIPTSSARKAAATK